jgi:hypothetical protein
LQLLHILLHAACTLPGIGVRPTLRDVMNKLVSSMDGGNPAGQVADPAPDQGGEAPLNADGGGQAEDDQAPPASIPLISLLSFDREATAALKANLIELNKAAEKWYVASSMPVLGGSTTRCGLFVAQSMHVCVTAEAWRVGRHAHWQMQRRL